MDNADLEQLKENLKNFKWRLNNLYYVRNKHGEKVLFKMNKTQEFVCDNLWYMNIITKARQLGMCLDPDTLVLTADFQWVKIGEMKAGMEIVSVDEYPPNDKTRRSRQMKKGVVEAVVKFKRETYKISFDDGTSMICTGKHPWLASKTNTEFKWMTIDGIKEKGRKIKNQLTVGSRIRRITRKWDNESSFEDGWVGGMIDGEGSLSKKSRAGCNLSISQVDGPVWDRLVDYFDKNKYHYRIERDVRTNGDSSKLGDKPVNKLVLSRMDEIFKLLGKTKPSRFAERDWWVNKELPYVDGDKFATITGIEYLGEREVVDLQTSTGTYIADGLVSHNTTFFTIFYLDQVLWGKDKIAGIIAHKQEDMKKIFRGKILFAVRNLDPIIQEMVGKPVIQTATEIVFDNGGEIFVSLSTRGGTVNFLHISEFGYICRHDPLKAEEIVNGAINSVHAGQMVSIESTAEGRAGYFYDFVQVAENKRKLGKKLTPLDFKSFFFPWYLDPSYTISGQEHYPLDQDDIDYFNKLEELTNVKLTKGQMVWYAKKKETLARQDITKLYTQFPSTIDEAFMASIEDAYYARHIGKVYLEKRSGFFPVDPRADVHIAWDLGMNDKTVMIFFQELGEEIRIVDHYSNNNEGLEHYTRLMADKGYKYGRCYLPHDAAVRDLSTGISREQFMWDLGVRNTMVCPKASVQDGIEKVRQILYRCRFNETKTQALLDSLQNYKKDKSKTTGEAMNTPRHDQYSHDADAFRVLAMAVSMYGNSSVASDINIQSFSY